MNNMELLEEMFYKYQHLMPFPSVYFTYTIQRVIQIVWPDKVFIPKMLPFLYMTKPVFPMSHGVSKFHFLIPKDSIYMVVSYIFIDICFVDLSFDAKVVEWSMTVFALKWNLTEKSV